MAANLNAVVELQKKCDGIPFVAVLVPSSVPRSSGRSTVVEFTSISLTYLTCGRNFRIRPIVMDGSHLSVGGHAFVGEKLFDKLRPLLK